MQGRDCTGPPAAWVAQALFWNSALSHALLVIGLLSLQGMAIVADIQSSHHLIDVIFAKLFVDVLHFRKHSSSILELLDSPECQECRYLGCWLSGREESVMGPLFLLSDKHLRQYCLLRQASSSPFWWPSAFPFCWYPETSLSRSKEDAANFIIKLLLSQLQFGVIQCSSVNLWQLRESRDMLYIQNCSHSSWIISQMIWILFLYLELNERVVIEAGWILELERGATSSHPNTHYNDPNKGIICCP